LDEIPNDGVAVAGELSDELTQQISDAMVAVMDTEEGAQAFDDVYSIEGLVTADLEALDAARQVEEKFAGLCADSSPARDGTRPHIAPTRSHSVSYIEIRDDYVNFQH